MHLYGALVGEVEFLWSDPLHLRRLVATRTAQSGSSHPQVLPATTPGWSPIDAADTPESADRVAEWMDESSGMTGDPKARPWNAQARKYLKGLLLAAPRTRSRIS